MQRKIFRGVGAVIASVENNVRFTVVPRMRFEHVTDFAVGRRIPIDLTRTPRRGSWAEVQLDDRGVDAAGAPLGSAMCPAALTGYHITSLGGWRGAGLVEDLSDGPFVGMVYLEQSFFDQYRTVIDAPCDPWPTTGVRSYQLTTIAYSCSVQNEALRNRRYVGFHGRITARTGTVATIQVFTPLGAPTQQTLTLDLASPLECAPNPPLEGAEVALRSTSQVGDEGAVFAEISHAALLDWPKMPVGLDA